MARWEFKLPDIGEGVTEGEIVSWLVKPGERVREDQPMVEVMTDKATVTIAAPHSGTILETRGDIGQIVAVHSTLVVFDLSDEAPAQVPAPPESTSRINGAGHVRAPEAAAEPTEAPAIASAVGDIREHLPGMGVARRISAARSSAGSSEALGFYSEKPLATAATRQAARSLGIDLRRVPPTGPQGRVTKSDVLAFGRNDNAASQTTANASAPRRVAQGEERVPFAGLRRKIAAKMQQSKRTAAHFTFVEECEVSELKAIRARVAPFAEQAGVRLTYLPFIVKATVEALKKHPILNSSLDEEVGELVFKKSYNIGIATATEAGLIVPVIRNADQMSILEIAKEIGRLADRARSNSLTLEELSGSTFTITSLGSKGGLLATPVINFPEVGILGVHRIKERPIVKDGAIVIGNVMVLSLSFDHRVVDGHVGAEFAYSIIDILEHPELMLLTMS